MIGFVTLTDRSVCGCRLGRPRDCRLARAGATPNWTIGESGCSVEVVAKGLPDHFGDRDAFCFGVPSEMATAGAPNPRNGA
jgi:hypothetical protein